MSIDAIYEVSMEDPFLHCPAPLSDRSSSPNYRVELRQPVLLTPTHPRASAVTGLSRGPSSSRQPVVFITRPPMQLIVVTIGVVVAAGGMWGQWSSSHRNAASSPNRGRWQRQAAKAVGRLRRAVEATGRLAEAGAGGTRWSRWAGETSSSMAGDGQLRRREWVLMPVLYFCVVSEPRPIMCRTDGASVGVIFLPI
jgi:hypothetical protein